MERSFPKTPLAGSAAYQQRQNKALHPTAYSPLVPRSLPAAGELGRCAAARGVTSTQSTLIAEVKD
jgi:hypothetical protein